MPVTSTAHDLDALTLTINAEFAAPVERVWQVYADARQLEQVWGPPGWPATFEAHDLTEGGTSHFYMTSPEGQKFYNFWNVTGVDEPRQFSFRDGFALDETYAPNTDMPQSHAVYSFAPSDAGTAATFVTTYETTEALEMVLSMGVIEGAAAAINQIDDFLAAS
jgi:uncharacterized protein YndB with AHSA1/START domain